MFICVYLCLFVPICAYLCLFVFICVYLCLFVFICVYLCLFVFICVYLEYESWSDSKHFKKEDQQSSSLRSWKEINQNLEEIPSIR